MSKSPCLHPHRKIRSIFALTLIATLLIQPFAASPMRAAASRIDEDQITPGLKAAIAETFKVGSGRMSNAPFTETSKFHALDDTTNEWFGHSVALSGDTALVGAPTWGNDLNDPGQAYIFYRDPGGDSWSQVVKLMASDAVWWENFGYALALDGDTALISGGAGKVYVFYRDQGGADNWGEAAFMTNPEFPLVKNFGMSVALDGDTAIIGFTDDNDDKGAIHVFYRHQGGADNWGHVVKVTAPDGVAEDRFGLSVFLDGDTALVGAPGFNDDQGSAYIFYRDLGGADNWGGVAKLIASDGESLDAFGFPVALSGDTAVVGAWFDDDKGDASGSAYIFERNQGGADEWGQVVKLTASDGEAGDYFSGGVSISGDTVLVGAPAHNDDAGSVYVFNRDQGGNDAWGQTDKLTSSDSASWDWFGYAMAIQGNTALIGSPYDDDNGDMSGSVYVFRSRTDTIGVFEPAGINRFQLRNTNDAGPPDLDFTFATDITDGIPITGDWDGDGLDTIGVFSPSLGEFRLRNSNDAGPADISFSNQKLIGVLPLSGDWNGDGVDTLGIYKNGRFYLRNSNNLGAADIKFFFSGADLIPITGDWNGDGIDTIGKFNPIAGKFLLRNANSAGPADITISHERLKGAIPLVGDWDGDGVDTLGIYLNGVVSMRNANFIAPPDIVFTYGGAGLLPITGDWDGS